MQIHLRKYFCYLFLSFSLLVSACRSQQAGFPASSATTPANPPVSSGNQPPQEPTKTVPKPAPKLVYDSTKISFKIKQKTEVETYKNADDDDDEVTVRKTETVQKYRKKKIIDDKWLSGGFLAAGMLLLATSLVLVIIGTGSAGLIAIIGGSLFLVGFIFTLVELLRD